MVIVPSVPLCMSDISSPIDRRSSERTLDTRSRRSTGTISR